MERICYCGETEDEHDETSGTCQYCDCESFFEDVDATLELAAEHGDVDIWIDRDEDNGKRR